MSNCSKKKKQEFFLVGWKTFFFFFFFWFVQDQTYGDDREVQESRELISTRLIIHRLCERGTWVPALRHIIIHHNLLDQPLFIIRRLHHQLDNIVSHKRMCLIEHPHNCGRQGFRHRKGAQARVGPVAIGGLQVV